MIARPAVHVRRLAPLAALVAFEVAAAVGLHTLGRSPQFALPRPLLDASAWESWLLLGRVDDCLAALLRLVALGFVVYLLLGTAAYVLARLGGAREAAGVARALLPAVRLVVDRALTVAVLTAVVGARPAVAAPVVPAGAPTVVVMDNRGEPFAMPPALVPPARAGPARTPADHGDRAAAHGARAALHVVAPGENLWHIAEQRLAPQRGVASPPAARAVHRYWTRLLQLNGALLRSDDPDLLHPGERLILPPLDTGHGPP